MRIYSKTNFIGALIILFAMIFEAIFFYDDSYKEFFLQKDDYLVTVGKIIESELYISHRVSSSRQLLMVKYTYKIHRNSYSSTRIVVDGMDKYMSDEDINRYFHQFPIGKTVNIYYLQDNPSFSVLDPDNNYYTTLIIRLLVFLGNIFLMLYGKYGMFKSTFESQKKK
jgi:hypothetical protein